MKYLLLLCFTVILLTFQVSCKEQRQTDKQKRNLKPVKSQSLEVVSTIKMADTVSVANAPFRITRKIRKTKDGNLLIAAFNNVSVYNGVTFSNLPKPQGLESFDAYDALEDSHGNIWIASTHYGVFRYDGKDFKHFTTDNGLVHNRAMDLHEDNAGNIWIATMGGVSVYNGNLFHNYTTNEGLTNNDVSTVMGDKTGKIWLGTRGTTCVYNPLTSTFTKVADSYGKPFTNVWSIIQDKKNNIWIGGEDGLWRYDGITYTNLVQEFVNCVYEDEKGNIWTTSPKGSLKCYNENLLLNKEGSWAEIYHFNGIMPFRVTGDTEGNIWVGTFNGILRYDGTSISHFRNLKK